MIAPFFRLYFAQSNMLTDRSMMLPSRLSSLFLKRNFSRPPWLETVDEKTDYKRLFATGPSRLAPLRKNGIV